MFNDPVFRLPSPSNHDFSKAPQANISRSSIDMSRDYKTAFDASYLVPFFLEEVLPGDTFNVKATVLARLSTPKYPTMDNLYLDTFFFYCPERLLWTNFKKMMGEQDNPADSISFTTPKQTIPGGGYALASLADYFGIPPGKGAGGTVRAAPFRMYNKTWNEWFRDENLQNSVTVDVGDGPDTASNYVLLKRGKRHDYFTSCLPWPQKGTAVTLPIGSTAPVLGIGIENTSGVVYANQTPRQSNGASPTMPWSVQPSDTTTLNALVFEVQTNSTSAYPNFRADLANATGATINQLIESFAIQDLLVRDARGGTRYTELVQSHFGVTSPDSRLQRVELLGTSSKPLSFYAVPNTSDTASYKQGALSAYAVGNINNEGFVKSFTEHGWIMGLVCLRADLTYQQGLHRRWSRNTRYDFYWPSLANLGEQSVLNKEIWYNGDANDNLVFGYQERWSEYRYGVSQITGIMRSDAAGTLDAWHCSEDFASLPALNSTFIQDPATTTIDRIIQVPSEPQIIFDSYIKVIAARPMPLYSVPSLGNRL